MIHALHSLLTLALALAFKVCERVEGDLVALLL